MEAQKKRSNLKQKKSDTLRFEERGSPLRNLYFHKSNPRITSNLPSAAASASVAARNGCLRFLRSSNSSSDASLPSSTCRINLERKPKSLPKVATNFSAKSFRSKENELPRKPFSEKSRKMQQLCVDGRGTGKSKTNPVSKAAQVSKLSRGRGNSVKKGSEDLGRKKLKNTGPSEPTLKSSTPAGSSSVRRNAAEESDSGTANGGSGSATCVKTPPVEVSVSPEIQSKMLVSKSAATPVCYGAGHLLSGVTDKRKCRRRGSLRGGFEKVNLFDDEEIDKNVVDDSQDSSIPLPAEASVRWLLSPCNEDHGSDSESKLEGYDMSCGNGSLSLDVLSSPPTLCGNAFKLGCENSDFRGSGSVDEAENLREPGIFMLSPQENCELESLLENSVKKMFDPFLAATPNSVSNCNSLSLGEGENVGLSVSGNSSAISLGSLSCGNIIQTPNSDCSSYECIRRSNVEVDKRSFVEFELDSVTETLDAMSLSSRSKSFPYAGLDSSSCSIPPIRLEKNVESFCSWESSSELGNLTLSQMKVSWRDGVECRTDELDEFDCCPRLSDEAIDAFSCRDQQLKPYRLSQSGGDEGNKREGKDAWIDDDVSPIVLEYEPCIRAAPKDKSSGHRLDECAESICTNGGDLAASSDSDWRVTCFRSSSHNCNLDTTGLSPLEIPGESFQRNKNLLEERKTIDRRDETITNNSILSARIILSECIIIDQKISIFFGCYSFMHAKHNKPQPSDLIYVAIRQFYS